MLAFRTVSADSHVVEPPDLWTRRIDRRFLARAPRIVSEADSDYILLEGTQFPKRGLGTIAAAGQPAESLGERGRWADVRRGAWDPLARLADLDRDGVEAEILYPSFSLLLFQLADLDLQHACFQASNDWLANFCQAAPRRLFGIGVVPAGPPERSVAELERCARMGLRGAVIGIDQEGELGHDRPAREPLWSAAEALGMPLSLHIAGSRRGFAHSQNILVDFALAYVPVMYALGVMIFGGVFDRHPKLRIVSAEHDAGWAESMLARMDYRYERDRFWARSADRITSGRLPSQQFREHVFCTFMRDLPAVRNLEQIGLSNVLWGSDYPHEDSTWPESARVLAEHFSGVPAQHARRLARSNAISLYRLPLEA
jgi:predicted TIM-barrel fold metal-dependent hydrolase